MIPVKRVKGELSNDVNGPPTTNAIVKYIFLAGFWTWSDLLHLVTSAIHSHSDRDPFADAATEI